MPSQEPESPPPTRRAWLVAVLDSCVFPRQDWIRPIVENAPGYAVLVWSPLIISEVNRLLTWRCILKLGGELNRQTWRECSERSKRWFSIMTRAFRVIDDRPPLSPLWINKPRDEWDWPIWTAAQRAKRVYHTGIVFSHRS